MDEQELITQRSREAVPTIPCKNMSGVIIPENSILQITGLSTGGRYNVSKPSSNNIIHVLVSPPHGVAVGADFNAYTIEDGYPAYRNATIATRDGVTAETWVSGQTLGVESGQWTLTKEKTGLVCLAVSGGVSKTRPFSGVPATLDPYYLVQLNSPLAGVEWFCEETQKYGPPAKPYDYITYYYGWDAQSVTLTTGAPENWVSPYYYVSGVIQNESPLRYGYKLSKNIDLQAMNFGAWYGKYFLRKTICWAGYYTENDISTGPINMSYDLSIDFKGFNSNDEEVEYKCYPFVSQSARFNINTLNKHSSIIGQPAGGRVEHYWHTVDTGGMCRNFSVTTPEIPKDFMLTQYRFRMLTYCDQADASYEYIYPSNPHYIYRKGLTVYTQTPACITGDHSLYLPSETWMKVKYDPADYEG